MEYIYLIIQIIFIIGTIFLPVNYKYLVTSNSNYKRFLISEIIIQGLCIFTNLISLFFVKEIMIYILVLHLVLMSVIVVIFEYKGKKIYFKELIDIIKKDDLLSKEANEIRKILLEKYEKLYFIEDIKKCIRHNKNN